MSVILIFEFEDLIHFSWRLILTFFVKIVGSLDRSFHFFNFIRNLFLEECFEAIELLSSVVQFNASIDLIHLSFILFILLIFNFVNFFLEFVFK